MCHKYTVHCKSCGCQRRMAETDEEDASSVLATDCTAAIQLQNCDTMLTFNANSDNSAIDGRCEVLNNSTSDNSETITACIEDRFRVDRRKLEQLLQVDGPEDNAEIFFAKIMRETSTDIAWPSKLKIGAKSKKDPYIKVSGTKHAVCEAKERILNILNTKSSRVTVKIEVSYTEHSHVIGKGGNNIKRVMHETGCHIHFPDSNRNNQVEKSNQVSIAGPFVGVEEARQSLRSLQPLVFMFDLPTVPTATDATNSAFIQRMQQMYEVGVMLKPQYRSQTMSPCTVVVRGSVHNTKAVKEATVALHDHFIGRAGVQFLVTLALDIAPQHHPVVIGQSSANVKLIMQRSGATVHFPGADVQSQHQQRGTVYITGLMTSVCLARNLLLGCIPMVLMFDIDEDADASQEYINGLMEQLGVFISVRPKPKQPTKSVVIKSMERNVANMYEARRLLFRMDPVSSGPRSDPISDSQNDISASTKAMVEIPSVPSAVSSDYFKGTTEAQLANRFVSNHYSNAGPFIHRFVQTPPRLPFHPVFQQAPVIVPPTYHQPVRLCAPVNSILQLSTPSLHCMEDTVTSSSCSIMVSPPASRSLQSASTQLLTVPEQTLGSCANSSAPVKSLPESLPAYSQASPKNLASQLVLKLQPDTVKSLINSDQSEQSIDLIAQMLNAISSVNQPSLPVHVDQHRSPTRGEAIGSMFGPPSNSDSNHSVADPWMPQSSPTGSFNSSGESTISDQSKAPGSNRPKKFINSSMYREVSDSTDFDYEQLRVKANRAIHTKPVGESRVPSDAWFGYGFSKSMPDADMRMRLNHNIVRGYRQTAMMNTYEAPKIDPTNNDTWMRIPNESIQDINDSGSMNGNPMGNLSHTTSSALGASMNDGSASSMIGVDDFGRNSFTGNIELRLPSVSSFASNHCYNIDVATSNSYSMATNGSLWPTPSERAESSFGATGKRVSIGQMDDVWEDKTEDLAELFGRLGLGKYTDLFQQQEIDMSTFLTLTDNDLKELGISTFGARRRMLNAIAKLSKRQSMTLPAPSRPPGILTSTSHSAGRHHDNIASLSGRW